MQDDQERSIVRRQLAPEDGSPGIQIAEVIAEIDDREMTEMSTMYDCVDGVLDEFFSDPPSADAQLMIEFSYEEYRITVCQDGALELVRPGS